MGQESIQKRHRVLIVWRSPVLLARDVGGLTERHRARPWLQSWTLSASRTRPSKAARTKIKRGDNTTHDAGAKLMQKSADFCLVGRNMERSRQCMLPRQPSLTDVNLLGKLQHTIGHLYGHKASPTGPARLSACRLISVAPLFVDGCFSAATGIQCDYSLRRGHYFWWCLT